MSEHGIHIIETDFGSKGRAKKATEQLPPTITAEGRWRLRVWWQRVLQTSRSLCGVDTGTLQATIRIEEKGMGGGPLEVVVSPEHELINSQIRAGGMLINPKTGRICVPSGTKIFTNPFELTKIEDVSLNDKTLDLKNNFEKINGVERKRYDGDLIRIKALGLLPFEVTPNHQILTVMWKSITKEKPHIKADWKGLKRGLICRRCGVKLTEENWYKSAKKKKDYICKGCRKSSRLYLHKLYKLGWKPAREVETVKKINKNNIKRIRECVVFPKYKKSEQQTIEINGRKFELDEDLARLFGLYVAEGCGYVYKKRKRSGRFNFTFGNHEKELMEFTLKTIKEKFGFKCGIQKRWATTLYKDNFEMTRFFRETFGEKSWLKKIPKFIMDSTKNITKAFIIGVWEGDGSKKGEEGGITIGVTSETLVLQLQKLLSKLDVFGGLSKHVVEEDPHIYVKENRLITSKHDMYVIQINGEQIKQLGFRHNKKKQKYFIEDENNFYLPIKIISRVPYNDLVWDISTNGTFQVNNIILHNCDYARFHHDGHFTRSGSFVPPNPFLTMAINLHINELYQILDQTLDKSVNTVWVGG